MNRRRFLSRAAALAIAGTASAARAQTAELIFPPEHPLQGAWQAWKALCLTPEGRVVDGFQNGATHSEGQSYGLTFAMLFGDTATFDSIHAWTKANLLVRGDALMAWRWKPDQEPPVEDMNNASDGDLLYAWALLKQGQIAQKPELIEEARAIAADLLRLCVVDSPETESKPIFLPGEKGFSIEGGHVLNPSYYIPHAMREIGSALDMPVMETLATDGEDMIAQLAEQGPVPDWIALTAAGIGAPPERFSQVSGYEAIRVPLYAVWSRRGSSTAVKRFAADTQAGGDGPDMPVVFDPATGAVVERSSHAGYRAIAALAGCASTDTIGSSMPLFTAEQPYYPASLHLLALVAQIQAYPRCIPI